MARLEIELDAKVSKAEKAISGVAKELTSLEQQYASTAKEIKKYSDASMRFEGALGKLNQEFKTGAISEQEYSDKSKHLTDSLERTREETRILTKHLNNLKTSIESVGGSSAKTSKGVKGLGDGMGIATQSLSRQVFAQRAALSASNNLTRAMTSLSMGTGTAASSFGVFGRQLALLSTSGGMSMKGLIASFSGPAGIAIAVSVAVTAITGFISNMQKAKRASKEAKEDLDAYTNSLQKFINTQDMNTRATNNGARAASAELAQLGAVRGMIENENISRKDRVEAIREQQRLYPDYFKDLTDEEHLAGQVAGAYRRLTNELMATAKARAAIELKADSIKKLVAVDLNRVARQRREEKINNKIIKQTEELRVAFAGLKRPILDVQGLVDSERGLKDILSVLTTIDAVNADSNKKLVQSLIDSKKALGSFSDAKKADFDEEIKSRQDIKDLEDIINNSTESGGKLFEVRAEKVKGYTRQMVDYAQKIQDVLDKGERSVDKTGLVGLDVEIEKTRQTYESLYVQLSKIEKNFMKDRLMGEKQRNEMLLITSQARIQLTNDEADEQSRNLIKYEEQTQTTIEQLRREAGVSLVKSREQELQLNENKYAKLVAMHKHNDEIIKELEVLRLSEINAINEKWNRELTTITIEQTRRLHEKKSQMMTRQINDEFRMRVKQANKDIQTEEARLKKQLELQQEYYERLDAIKKFEEMESAALQFGDAVGSAFSSMLTDGTNVFQSLVKEFKKAVTQMIAQAVALNAANLFGKLLNIGTVATGGGIFGNIFKKLIGSGGFGGGGIPRNRMAMASTGTDMMMASAQTKSQGNLVSSVNNGTFTGDGNNSVASSGGMKIEVKMDDVRLSGSDLLLSQKRESKKQHRFYNT